MQANNFKQLNRQRNGFSLIELLVVIVIIGLLVTFAVVSLGPARNKARDVKRKAGLSQIGKLLTLSCFLPQAGAGEYDLTDLAEELKQKYPQFASYLGSVPKDPKTGTDEMSNYKYVVDTSGNKCALYANLENKDEVITINDIILPTPGRGTGVFQAAAEGWNGSRKFFQYSN